MQTQVDDGGDRCYRVSDGEDDSVNVRLIGKCDSKNNENDEMDDAWWKKLSKDQKEQIKKKITKMGKKGTKPPLRSSSVGGGRKRKSRKSKRKLRRKNRRKSKRKNRKSRRKSIKR